MAKYFPGTNIPLSSFKGSDNKKEELIERLQNDMDAGDIDGMNDAIFSVAYWSTGGEGQGQGNANVSKVHKGTWEVTADVGDNRSWAETSINSENDVYIQKDGSVITYDDDKGAAKDGVSSGTWGGQGTGENNPHSGDAPPPAGVAVKPPVEPVISGGGGNSSANYAILDNIWKGEFADLAAAGIGDYGKTDTSSTKSGWNVGGPGGAAGETSLLAYRPGSEAYWKSYMGPDLTGSLMRMKQPAITQAALSYLPGEQRHPFAWLKYLGMGGINDAATSRNVDKQFQGAIPQGVWSSDHQRYRALTQSRGTGDTYISGYQGAPWQFAAAPSGMINQPAWTASGITPAPPPTMQTMQASSYTPTSDPLPTSAPIVSVPSSTTPCSSGGNLPRKYIATPFKF